MKKILSILGVLLIATAALAETVPTEHQRQIPVFVVGKVEHETLKSGAPIPLTITITNGLPSSIYLVTFSLLPKDWIGETVGISLVDIYRDGTQGIYTSQDQRSNPREIYPEWVGLRSSPVVLCPSKRTRANGNCVTAGSPVTTRYLSA